MTMLERLRAALVDEVPAAIAACEFECQATQCLLAQWEACPRRRAAARAHESRTT